MNLNSFGLNAINRLLRRRGYRAVKKTDQRALELRLKRLDLTLRATRIALGARNFDVNEVARVTAMTRSQLGQDVFALLASGTKRNGFFVEFGASNGEFLSNTWLLEKEFNWSGILAEPLIQHQRVLQASRTAVIESSCVWSASGEVVEFLEANDFSTIARFRNFDHHGNIRRGAKVSKVPTISLIDLLRKHRAPRCIDFLSIDTEGSEFDILSAFPFNSEYRILAIACEHNFTANRKKIQQLLAGHGYRRVFEAVSDHDDWFIVDDADMLARWRPEVVVT